MHEKHEGKQDMGQLVSYLNELTVVAYIDALIGKMHIEIWSRVQ